MLSKRLVLVGAGHAHVEVLRRLSIARAEGVALTVISPYTHVPYTGMIPGVVAGRYALAEASIDAAGLAARACGVFVHARAIAVDRARRIIACEGGDEVPYDLLSINVGGLARNPLAASGGAAILATKPVEPFMAALGDLGAPAVAVIGAGFGGIELAAALRHRGAGVSLIAGRAGLAPAAPAAARAMIERRLKARGVSVISGADAVGAEAGRVVLGDGREIDAGAVILAAGVGPPALIASLDLPKDGRGFLKIGPTLQSPADPHIFAVGDSASLPGVDKAGVYAVRQGPVLAGNLRAALAGGRLRSFHPQTDYLAIISFWPDAAVAVRGRLAAEGRWADRWKEWIDRRFIEQYR